MYKIIKYKETSPKTCTACIALVVGIIGLWCSQYPVILSQILRIPSSMYIYTYMVLYMTSLLIYISPLFFLENKWKGFTINISIGLLLIISTHHYTDVINTPYLYLDLNNHMFNLKAAYV